MSEKVVKKYNIKFFKKSCIFYFLFAEADTLLHTVQMQNIINFLFTVFTEYIIIFLDVFL